MAQRRMFSQKIVGSDAFIEMPVSARELYFQLGMYADDDGFINPKKIVRMVGASDDDLKLLSAKRFVLPFENGVVVIKHWKINNLIRKDFYEETIYLEQKNTLEIKENKAYTECLQNVNNLSPQYSIGKVSIGQDSIDYRESTPSNTSKDFFNNIDKQEEALKNITERTSVSEKIIRMEISKFISYWTEPNKSGTKQRWELEKTFEVGRRLSTWLSKINSFNKGDGMSKTIII